MATETWTATPDLVPDILTQDGRSFSFYQLNRLLMLICDQQGGEHIRIRYQGKKSLAFPASDIDRVTLSETAAGAEINIVLSFMGLYGPSSPLPAFYTERLLHSDDDSEAMRKLFDLLNHHLIKNLQTIWEKYRYYVQFGTQTDGLSHWLFGLAGLPPIAELEQAGLNWARLLPMAPLLAMKTKNASGLERVLCAYFPNVQFAIEQCVARRVRVPLDQSHAMGMDNSTLGIDIVMGDEVLDRMSKFRIHATPDKTVSASAFFPGQPQHDALKALVRLYLRDQFDFDVSLTLHAQELAERGFGEQGPRLGWNSVMGDPAEYLLQRVCVA